MGVGRVAHNFGLKWKSFRAITGAITRRDKLNQLNYGKVENGKRETVPAAAADLAVAAAPVAINQ